MFESAVRSSLARRHTITIIVYRCPVTHSSHFFNKVNNSPVPRAPPIFRADCNKSPKLSAKGSIFHRFFPKTRSDSLQCRCRGGRMVLYLDRAAPFSGSRTAFCQSAGQAARRGAASFPWGGLYHHTRGPGQPAALRRLAAGREEEEHKK